MLSLLVAIFGKGRIPNSARLALFTVGIGILLYRLNRLRIAHKSYQEAMVISQEIQSRQNAKASAGSPEQNQSPPATPLTNAQELPQNLSGFLLSLRG